jgi:hypothetical protein
VVEKRRAEEDLQDPSDRAGVERQHVVVERRVDADQPDVEHVQEDEEPDRDARDAMERPGEHPLATAVAEQHEVRHLLATAGP